MQNSRWRGQGGPATLAGWGEANQGDDAATLAGRGEANQGDDPAIFAGRG